MFIYEKIKKNYLPPSGSKNFQINFEKEHKYPPFVTLTTEDKLGYDLNYEQGLVGNCNVFVVEVTNKYVVVSTSLPSVPPAGWLDINLIAISKQF